MTTKQQLDTLPEKIRWQIEGIIDQCFKNHYLNATCRSMDLAKMTLSKHDEFCRENTVVKMTGEEEQPK